MTETGEERRRREAMQKPKAMAELGAGCRLSDLVTRYNVRKATLEQWRRDLRTLEEYGLEPTATLESISDECSVEVLKAFLRTRTANCLKNEGLTTVGQVRALQPDALDEMVRSGFNFGDQCLEDLLDNFLEIKERWVNRTLRAQDQSRAKSLAVDLGRLDAMCERLRAGANGHDMAGILDVIDRAKQAFPSMSPEDRFASLLTGDRLVTDWIDRLAGRPKRKPTRAERGEEMAAQQKAWEAGPGNLKR